MRKCEIYAFGQEWEETKKKQGQRKTRKADTVGNETKQVRIRWKTERKLWLKGEMEGKGREWDSPVV